MIVCIILIKAFWIGYLGMVFEGGRVMKDTAKHLLIWAVASGAACLLQLISLVRYWRRLPDDWLGIGLYLVSIVGFALGAIGGYIQWTKEGDQT